MGRPESGHALIMEKHYLTPLFLPESIAVFAGPKDSTEPRFAQAQAVSAALRAQRFAGQLVFIDIHTTGTLADLADRKSTRLNSSH